MKKLITFLLATTLLAGTFEIETGQKQSKPKSHQQILGKRLIRALKKENQEKAIQLLNDPNKEIDLTRTDDDGKTAFHLACEKGYLKVVKKLVERGADINSKGNSLFNIAPLTLAHKAERFDIVTYLIELPSTNLNNLETNVNFDPILIWCCKQKQVDLLKKLMQYGPRLNFNLFNSRGETALSVCIQRAQENEKVYSLFIALLLKGGALINGHQIRELLRDAPTLPTAIFNHLAPLSFNKSEKTAWIEKMFTSLSQSFVNNKNMSPVVTIKDFEKEPDKQKFANLITTILHAYLEKDNLRKHSFKNSAVITTIPNCFRELAQSLMPDIMNIYGWKSLEDVHSHTRLCDFAQAAGRSTQSKYKKFHDISIAFDHKNEVLSLERING